MSGPATAIYQPSPAHLAAAVAVALAAWAGTAGAAGLGRLQVSSALGQPLQAELEITAVTPEEAATLSARLASPDAFRAAGLQFSNALAGLRMSVQERGGRHFIRLSSANPMNEPFVDLMVELNWASGKFVREYTFLLDPPELRASRQTVEGGAGSSLGPGTSARAMPGREQFQPSSQDPSQSQSQFQSQPQRQRQAQVESPPPAETAQARAAAVRARGQAQSAQQPPATAGSSRGAGSADIAATRSMDGAGDPAATPAEGARSDSVTVARGDSLGKIAAANKPADATLEQTVIAIFQANRSAFIGNNPNLIREGRTLSIPDEAAIAAVDPALAQRQLRVAAQNFRAYKNRLAAAPAQVTNAGAGNTASGPVTAQEEDPGARPGGSDRLELSKSTGSGGPQAGPLGSRDAEARVARDAALAESSSRIAELERNVSNLQKMLELKNRSLADLQTQMEQLRGTAPAGTGSAAATGAAGGSNAANAPNAPNAGNAANAPNAGNAGSAPNAGNAPNTPNASRAASDAAAAGLAAGAAPSSPPAPAAAPPASAAGAAAGSPGPGAPATVAPVAQAPGSDPGRSTPAAAAPSQPAEPSLLGDLMDGPMVLPALGGLALLIALGLWMAMRRRHAERFEDSLVAADPYTANSLFGATDGHHVDTGPGTQSQITTMSEAALTEVDPIAEADVYIAYGREAQAEEILKEALTRQPERQAIRLKLSEIHAGRKDARAFEATAREMYGMTAGQNEEWPRVAAMGLALEPENPLYASGAAQAAAVNSSFGRASAATSLAAASAAAVLARPPLYAEEATPLRVNAPPDLPDHRQEGGLAARQDSGHDPASDPTPAHGADSPRPDPVLEPERFHAVDDVPDLDFKLDFDAPAQPVRAGVDDEPDGSPSFVQSGSGPLSAMPNVDLPSLDLDLPPPSPAPAERNRQPAGSGDFASSPQEDSRPRPAPDRAPAFEPEMDLSAIGLDLEPSSTSGPSSTNGASPGQWQEMASKLDLASAYGEIGDKEGARELLHEVVRGGDASQQRKARELLATI